MKSHRCPLDYKLTSDTWKAGKRYKKMFLWVYQKAQFAKNNENTRGKALNQTRPLMVGKGRLQHELTGTLFGNLVLIPSTSCFRVALGTKKHRRYKSESEYKPVRRLNRGFQTKTTTSGLPKLFLCLNGLGCWAVSNGAMVHGFRLSGGAGFPRPLIRSHWLLRKRT